MNLYEEKFNKIWEKIAQVLRIKKQLESRRLAYLGSLSSASNPNEASNYLSLFENTYKREERVFYICEKGLIEIWKILAEVDDITKGFLGISFRMKAMAQIFGRNKSQSFTPILKDISKHLRNQIAFLEENLGRLKKNIGQQHIQILDLTIEIRKAMESGVNHVNIPETKYFVKIEELHQEELRIVQEVERSIHSKKTEMIMLMNKFSIKMSQNRVLAAMQIGMGVAPMANPATALAVSTLFLGPQFVPIVWPTLILIKWSPLIYMLSAEQAIKLKKPAARAREAATLRIKAIKMRLEVPQVMMGELAAIVSGAAANRAAQAANIFRRQPRQPGHAYTT